MIRPSECLVINQIALNKHASLFNCKPVGRAVRLNNCPGKFFYVGLVGAFSSTDWSIGVQFYFRFSAVLSGFPEISICHGTCCLCRSSFLFLHGTLSEYKLYFSFSWFCFWFYMEWYEPAMWENRNFAYHSNCNHMLQIAVSRQHFWKPILYVFALDHFSFTGNVMLSGLMGSVSAFLCSKF